MTLRRKARGARPAGILLAAAILAMAVAAFVAAGQETGHPADQETHKPGAPRDPHDATSEHRFTGVDRWVKVFDDPGRDFWQKPDRVVEALGLKPGMVVADLGAGTGYFMQRLSRAVAPGGMVLAIDTEPEMVAHLGERAKRENLDNAVPVLALGDRPFLPAGRVDRVLIVDTFHHINDRLDYLGRLKKALTPGGRLVVIDFHKKPLPVGPPPEHKLERQFVIDEVRQTGWRLEKEETFLPYQYFLIFAPGAN
jgi:SAM-dependent methyltransferase